MKQKFQSDIISKGSLWWHHTSHAKIHARPPAVLLSLSRRMKCAIVGNASRPLRSGAPTGATSSGAMAMARDPGHGGLAFLHSSVFHFLSSLLLHTSIYLTIRRITFISLLLFRDLSLVLSPLAPLAPGLLLKTATTIRYLVTCSALRETVVHMSVLGLRCLSKSPWS